MHKIFYMASLLLFVNISAIQAAFMPHDPMQANQQQIEKRVMGGAIAAGIVIGAETTWLMFSPKSEKLWKLLPFKIYQKYQDWKKPYKNSRKFKVAEICVKWIAAIGIAISGGLISHKALTHWFVPRNDDFY